MQSGAGTWGRRAFEAARVQRRASALDRHDISKRRLTNLEGCRQ